MSPKFAWCWEGAAGSRRLGADARHRDPYACRARASCARFRRRPERPSPLPRQRLATRRVRRGHAAPCRPNAPSGTHRRRVMDNELLGGRAPHCGATTSAVPNLLPQRATRRGTDAWLIALRAGRDHSSSAPDHTLQSKGTSTSFRSPADHGALRTVRTPCPDHRPSPRAHGSWTCDASRHVDARFAPLHCRRLATAQRAETTPPRCCPNAPSGVPV